MSPATQGTLAGVEAAPEPPGLPDHAPRVAVQGLLLVDAIVRVGSSGRVKLEVLIQQQLEHHPQATPLLATETCQDLGCFDTTHAGALRRAELMRAGAEIVVLGRGLEPGHHAGAPVLRLIRCDGIVPALLANHHPTSPSERPHAH